MALFRFIHCFIDPLQFFCAFCVDCRRCKCYSSAAFQRINLKTEGGHCLEEDM